MSERMMWKMIHLLYLSPKPKLSGTELADVGVDCYQDTIQELLSAKVVKRSSSNNYILSDAARQMLKVCVVANKRHTGQNIRVDYPHAFVIMPFSYKWSDQVYERMIEPAVKAAGFECSRGDTTVRVGDLTTNIWNEILQAGIIIADISEANVNVFYELGLVHALGKETLLIKRKSARLPADFGGAHYYEYQLNDLPSGKKKLKVALDKWAKDNKSTNVRDLLSSIT
jgi:hypothetical protein